MNLVDKAISYFNPQKAYRNVLAREMLERAIKFGYQQARRNRIQAQKTGLGGSGDKHADKANLWTLREYSRALDRDNLIASAILDRASESIIGSGIDVQVQSDNRRWDDKVEQYWREWWDNEADIRGLHAGWQIEQLAYRSMQVDGDILFVLTSEGQIQAIEADRIMSPSDIKDEICVQGVQVDRYGRPVAFWVAPQSESRSYMTYKKTEMYRYDAKDVVYLPNMNRFSLTRGVPVFASNMQLFDDIDAFIETCILHAKTAASHVLFVERTGGASGIDGVETVEDSYGNERQEQVVSPGMIMYGNPGEKATMVGTTQTMVQFAPFVQQLLRFTGLKFGMPLEMLALDFSQTTFSSARAALQVAQKSFMTQHKIMVRRFIEPIMRWKVDQWVKEGRFRRKDYSVSATPPKSISVDPLKEVNAEVQKTQHGFSTNREVCAAQGMDWMEIINQRAKEIETVIDASEKIAKKYNKKIDWRDLIGDANNYDSSIYGENDEEDTKED